ncbi:MAG: DUF3298 domain-containing protein [Bacteroidota bacterium]|nr:DUF3298 and DUF4163 domain-containing protein [Candidatus Kapabacteria bacterium]MDW8219045.1 DUF3298 domain-containing protein [Bacteroidota bacterium]
MRISLQPVTCAAILVFSLPAACAKSNQSPALQNTTSSNAIQSSHVVLATDSAAYVFEGTIGNKFRVSAHLTFERDTVYGTYRYYTSAHALSLRGKLTSENTIQIVERDELSRENWDKGYDQTISGYLVAQLNRKEGTISGTWTSKDRKKSMPFTLRIIAKLESFADPRLSVKVSYPVFAAPELAALNDTVRSIAKTRYQQMSAVIDAIRRDYGDSTDEETQEQIKMLNASSLAEVVYASTTLVSVLWAEESYTGGAHTNYAFDAITWKIEQGRPTRIALSTIFKPESKYPSALSGLLLQDLKRQQASTVVDNPNASFVDDIEQEVLIFTVHPSGLTVHFAPYIVGSYAEGTFEVHIPWKRVKDLLRNDGIVASLLRL